jgi:hypothetical protein
LLLNQILYSGKFKHFSIFCIVQQYVTGFLMFFVQLRIAHHQEQHRREARQGGERSGQSEGQPGEEKINLNF